jgi:hypothetical protein
MLLRQGERTWVAASSLPGLFLAETVSHIPAAQEAGQPAADGADIPSAEAFHGMRLLTLDPDDFQTASWTAYLSSVPPNVALDRTGVFRVLERARVQDPKNHYYARGYGAALLRAGKPVDAIVHLEAAAEVADTILKVKAPDTWLLLALAQHQAGKPEEARRWLEKGIAWHNEAVAEKPTAPSRTRWQKLSWVYRLTIELLRREAEGKIR